MSLTCHRRELAGKKGGLPLGLSLKYSLPRMEAAHCGHVLLIVYPSLCVSGFFSVTHLNAVHVLAVVASFGRS